MRSPTRVKYLYTTDLDPDDVFTTEPLAAPFGTGDVVTASPSEKFGDPEIFPVIEPSEF